MVHWNSFQKRTGLQPLGTVFTVKKLNLDPVKDVGSTSSVLLWLQSENLKKKIKGSTAKTGIFHRVDKLLEMSEIHLFWEGAAHSHFSSPAISPRVKSLSEDWFREKTATTMLNTRLLGERYTAYCNCKKIKRKQISWELFRTLPPLADVNEIFPILKQR